MRDRLIEMIQDSVNGCARNWAEIIADYLLKNGVIVPPCKVGDKVYYLATECDNCAEQEDYCYRGCKKPKGYTKVNKTVIEQFRIRGDQFDSMTDTKALASTYSHDFYFRDIGKTVFLTREEAERALKGGNLFGNTEQVKGGEE